MVKEIDWNNHLYMFKWLYNGFLYSEMEDNDGHKMVMLVPKVITATDAIKVYDRACCLRR
jgi:hypothetical protein